MGPRMIVSVFGGSSPQPGSSDYLAAKTLGEKLAKAGHIVASGGYIGTMEAVSAGASEAGGHVIGVTCEEIERWRKVGANRWVKQEIHCGTLIERLEKLTSLCDAAIALPGGPGTLTEIALLWNLMIVEAVPRKPLILVGAGWQHTFDQFSRTQGQYTNHAQLSLLTFVDNIEQIEL